MNTKNFFTGRTIGFIVVLLIVVGYALVDHFLIKKNAVEIIPEETSSTETAVAPVGKPSFAWVFDYNQEGDFPKTSLGLAATYENGVVLTKAIDTPDGSCNVYDDKGKDAYAKADMIICYAAGLGHYYKVVEFDGAYLVQRKTFEEGSPEYNPPVQQFETIAQF